MKTWSAENTGYEFTQMVDACMEFGPQMVTLNGTEVALLVPLQRAELKYKPTLSELLSCDWARTDNLAPDRSEIRKGTLFSGD